MAKSKDKSKKRKQEIQKQDITADELWNLVYNATMRALQDFTQAMGEMEDATAEYRKEPDAISALRQQDEATPNEIAQVLGKTGEAVRQYLRANYNSNGKGWHLNNAQINEVLDHFLVT